MTYALLDRVDQPESVADTMADTQLLFTGLIAITPLLYMLHTTLSLARAQDARAGTLSGLVALVSVVVALSLLVVDTFGRTLAPLLPLTVFITGLALFIFGAGILRWVERLRPGYRPEYSFGLLAAGIGALLMTAAVFVPLLPSQFVMSSQGPVLVGMTAMTATDRPAINSPSPTASATLTPTNRPTRTVSAISPTPLPTTTPTRTHYRTRTPAPRVDAGFRCDAIVDYNLNLRAAPGTGAAILTVIPYGSRVQVAGRNKDSNWWLVEYNDLWGWVSGEYITLESQCRDAPLLE